MREKTEPGEDDLVLNTLSKRRRKSRDKEGEFHLDTEELELYLSWFKTYLFWKSEGQFEALSQMLLPHLRKQSSS